MTEETKAPEKPYLSSSRLTTFQLCPESYRRQYIEKDYYPPFIHMPVGSGVHVGANVNFEQKIESHEDMKTADIVDAAVTGFEERIEQDGLSLTEDQQTVGKTKILGEAKDKVARLSGLFAEETAPEYQPVMVEKKQRLVLPESPYDIVAVMDLADDKGRVTDLKTAKRSKKQHDVDSSEQLSVYSLVYKAQFKKLPTAVRLEFLIDTKSPKRQMFESDRTMQDLQIVLFRLNTMIDAIKKGVFMPCSSISWKCSPSQCQFYRTCKYVMRKG